MLILTRKKGESFFIGDDIELIISDISGDQVKIGIKAPNSYKILRKELVQTIENNRLAASGPGTKEVRGLLERIKKNSPSGAAPSKPAGEGRPASQEASAGSAGPKEQP